MRSFLSVHRLHPAKPDLFSRTLVGAGLRPKTDFKRPLVSLVPPHISHIAENVKSCHPETSSVKTTSGREISYDSLVMATGLKINWDRISGLQQALTDPSSGVSSIYSYDTCDKVHRDLDALKSGNAIFTQPVGIIKCPGGMSSFLEWTAVLPSLSSAENHVDGLGQVSKIWPREQHPNGFHDWSSIYV